MGDPVGKRACVACTRPMHASDGAVPADCRPRRRLAAAGGVAPTALFGEDELPDRPGEQQQHAGDVPAVRQPPVLRCQHQPEATHGDDCPEGENALSVVIVGSVTATPVYRT